MNLFAGQNRDRDVEKGHMDTEKVGEGGTNSSIDVYTPPRVKYIASGKLLYSTGSSAWCSVMTYRGGTEW